MNDQYLWDGSGEPDSEIQRLENTLAQFRHTAQTPDFPVFTATPSWRFWHRSNPMRAPFRLGLAGAAAIMLLAAAASMLRWSHSQGTSSQSGWNVERVAGTPQLKTGAIGKNAESGKLGIGETLITDSDSRATISLAEIGTINIEPNTRLRLISGRNGRNKFSLERGTIHAFIWAAPGDFAVDTPSAIAVDLGCAYTLQVDDSGAGLLRTTLGWVGFRLKDREAFIPAGAACETRPKVGPGTPYFEDASASFREALSRIDFAAGTLQERSAELAKILAESRPRDALSLWHLLSRVDNLDRGRVYDRLAALVPPPKEVTRDGILHLDQKMLDQWWNQLGLGDVSLWRTWERSWAQSKT